ncbi:cytochrome P450 [Punctularia strigosozonata HHB-11173 SS5]|uniref:cytochrome P450 n=1 Tax=Punctularia strigosozonata (strain HHB-11173) TaxID=741275 RepID=UPI000441696E|nr:cytochrome P450 [Punctularia strigosozonata HHB-11173 SS5]EIN11990.1 cytochrome P450 [Punctularia strigosozonata HHB-11173 SS5]
MSEEMLVSMCVTYIIAGTDTTGTTLSWLMWALASHPHVYDTLRAELIAAFPDPGAFPDLASLRKLLYLTAVIKEALRRYPATPIYLPRVVPEGGAVHQGHYLPAGTTIGCLSYAMHRDEEFFPNPEVYDPSRWLEHVDGVLKVKNTPELTASFAELEIYTVIANLVRRYKFKPGPHATHQTMKDVDLLILKPKGHKVELVFEKNPY